MIRSPYAIFLVVLVFLASIGGNIYFGYSRWVDLQKPVFSGNETPATFPLLSPRIFAEQKNDVLINFLSLRNELREYAAEYGDSIGIYFEYLPSGTSIGIYEKKDFIAASLIKVPVVMAYYRQQEASGLSRDNEIIHLEERDIDKGYGSLWKRGVGTEVRLEDLIRMALVESDNTAIMALSRTIPQEYFDDVYEGLDIDFTKVNNRVIISPKEYASILKALYLSSVVSKESSQKILAYLAEHSSEDKLIAGIPGDVTVANKFGVYQEGNVYQDCGVVYVPKRPYVLCVMSESSEQEARVRMATVSRKIYQFVVNANK